MTVLDIPGILVLYHRPSAQDASTVIEHVDAFRHYSQFRVWNVNTEFGFPSGLEECQFQTIVLHYSLFSPSRYLLNQRFLDLLDRSATSYKIAVFQDEHHYCRQRFAFLDRYKFDCVYSLLEPAYFEEVYGKHTRVPKIVYNIPGYVPDELIALGQQLTKPDHQRRIDVGYRGRKLAPYMGRGSQEKYEIALGFRQRAEGTGLKLDIEVDERRRIYGDRWPQFIADCRAVLGVEAGVSIFDIDDVVRREYERIQENDPKANLEDVAAPLLRQWEGNIPYRTVSPRHFEAAAMRTCQILFEGAYSGIMQPMVHYIPLKKDFSNFDMVLRLFKDEALRRELVDNAYRDLIASGEYSYRRFVETFDQELLDVGLQPQIAPALVAKVDRLLKRDRIKLLISWRYHNSRHNQFPGRQFIRPFLKPVMARIESRRQT